MRLSPFALERYFARHEFSARRLLSSSDCESLAMAELQGEADEECRALWRDLLLGYTESRGLPLLRREIAGLYAGLDADHIVEVVPSEGIFLATAALVRPGDRVVVALPAYQSLHEIARAIGCEIVPWAPVSDERDGWRFDVDALARIAAGARLIVLNAPHNPTGWLPTRGELDRILAIADAAGAWVLSDEMYRFLEHEPGTTLPAAVERHPRAITLGGLSKSFGLPGLRVGWLAAQDRAFLERVVEVKDYTTICGSAPSEILAVMALRARERIIGRNLALVRKNLDIFDRWIAEGPPLFRWRRPRAGSVGLAELLAPEPATVFCERLVREAGIMMAPASLLGGDERHVRVGFGRADFSAALDELRSWARHRKGGG